MVRCCYLIFFGVFHIFLSRNLVLSRTLSKVKNENVDPVVENQNEHLESLKEYAELLKKHSFVNECDNFTLICKNQVEYIAKVQKYFNSHDKVLDYLKNKEELSVPEQTLKVYLEYIKEFSLNIDIENDNNTSLEDVIRSLVNIIEGNYPDIIGQWPVNNPSWKSGNFSLEALLASLEKFSIFNHKYYFKLQLRSFSTPKLVELWIYPSKKHSTFNFGLAKDVLGTATDIISDYEKFQFEYDKFEENFNDTESVTITNFGELKKLYPTFDWDLYIKVLTNDEVKLDDDFQVRFYNDDIKNFKINMGFITSVNQKVATNYFFVLFILNIVATRRWYMEGYNWRLFKNSELASVYGVTLLKSLYGEEKYNALIDLINLTFENLDAVTTAKGLNTTELNEFYQDKLDHVYFPGDENRYLEKFENLEINSTNIIETDFALSQSYLNYYLRPHRFIETDMEYFIESIESSYGKPFSVLYKILSNYFFREYDPNVSYEQRLVLKNIFDACGSETLSHHPLEDQIIVKTFIDWRGNHSDVLDDEEEILKNYGLTNSKVLFNHIALNSLCEVTENPYGELENSVMFLKDMKQFGEVFNCPEGSKMNPKEKCYYENLIKFD